MNHTLAAIYRLPHRYLCDRPWNRGNILEWHEPTPPRNIANLIKNVKHPSKFFQMFHPNRFHKHTPWGNFVNGWKGSIHSQQVNMCRRGMGLVAIQLHLSWEQVIVLKPSPSLPALPFPAFWDLTHSTIHTEYKNKEQQTGSAVSSPKQQRRAIMKSNIINKQRKSTKSDRQEL